MVVVFAVAIGVRLVDIQFVDGKKWIAIAEDSGLKYRTVEATRGNIYSDNGSLMATSLPFYKVAFDPSIADESLFAKGIDSLSLLLSRHFGDKSAKEYKRRINNARISKKKYLVLNWKIIDYQEKKKMSEWPIFRDGRLGGGVIFEKVDKRFLPFSHLGGRTIGYINDRNSGVGLEYSFNKYLAGKDGEALFQKMAGGNWKPVYDDSEVRPEEGLDIETTIDINLQDVSESALLRALIRHEADFGCVVVMEVATGEIKAISNLKGYGDGKYREVYNYAVQGLTEPGSTFKLASMIALFEDSNLKLSDSIDTGEGTFKFFDRTMVDHKPGGYGSITVRDAFEKSSNIAISKMVQTQFGLNPQRYVDYIKSFGLAEPLGFQMIGEGVPFVKQAKDPSWSGVTLPWMSIGYELKLTPLQTLTFYNGIANSGKVVQPFIVKKIKKADKVVEEYQPKIIKDNICSAETLDKVKAMLEGVVENGTARNISDSHYKIAGKTGTAQIITDGRYTRKYYTSFAGYFPADRPKYSCIVVINNPKGYEQYGSDVAAPVFKEIADKIYARDLEMHPPYSGQKPLMAVNSSLPVINAGYADDLQLICNALGIPNLEAHKEDWVKAKGVDNTVIWEDNRIEASSVPDVLGMTLKDALFLLENKGLRVEIIGRGRVVNQSIGPGKKAEKGSHITIKLS